MSGEVVWYNTRVGYGFVKGDDGQDYFAHHSRIVSEKKNPRLKAGAKVTFEVAKTDDGRQCANNIKIA